MKILPFVAKWKEIQKSSSACFMNLTTWINVRGTTINDGLLVGTVVFVVFR